MRSSDPIRSVHTRLWLFAVLVALSAMVIPGCGRGGPKVYPVRGRVVVDGQPVSGAAVTFHPVGSAESLRPSALTDEQGYFSLTSYVSGDGAPDSDYAVTVTLYRVISLRPQAEGDETTRNVLPPRYANPAESQLKTTVSKGKNELSPFELSAR